MCDEPVNPKDDPEGYANIGVCAVDCATGRIRVGMIASDDESRGGLRALLAEIRPVELVVPSSGKTVTIPTMRALRNGAANGHLLKHLPFATNPQSAIAKHWGSNPETDWPVTTRNLTPQALFALAGASIFQTSIF